MLVRDLKELLSKVNDDKEIAIFDSENIISFDIINVEDDDVVKITFADDEF